MSLRTRLLVGMAFVAAVLVVVAGDRHVDDPRPARSTRSTTGSRRTPVVVASCGWVSRATPAMDRPDGRRPGRRSAAATPSRATSTRTASSSPCSPRTSATASTAAPELDAEDLPTSGSRTLTVDAADGGGTYRVLARRVGDVTSITALPLDDVQRTISRLVLVEVVGSLAILAALGVVSWWVVHLGHPPDQGDDRHGDPDRRRRPGGACAGVGTGHRVGRAGRRPQHDARTPRRALDERAESEGRLRRFVADASHELRTPVTTIRGYAELYRHGGLAEPAALDDAMRRTEQEAARIGRLVDDMLALAGSTSSARSTSDPST